MQLNWAACCAIVSSWAFQVAVVAQTVQVEELRSWEWKSADVTCGAASPSGATAVVVDQVRPEQAILRVFDVAQQKEIRQLQYSGGVRAVNMTDDLHVDIMPSKATWGDGQGWLRMAIGDSQILDAPQRAKQESEDVCEKSQRLNSAHLGKGFGLVRESDGGVWWYAERSRKFALTNRCVRSLWTTKERRHMMAWLPEKLVAIALDGDGVIEMPVRASEVLAVAGGIGGEEVVVVTSEWLYCIDAGTGKIKESIAHIASHATHATMSPMGTLLICQGRSGPIVLVDMHTRKVKTIDQHAKNAHWSLDGEMMCCIGASRAIAWKLNGDRLWELETPFAAPIDAAAAFGILLDKPASRGDLDQDWTIVLAGMDKAVIGGKDKSWLVRTAGAGSWEKKDMGILGMLSDGERCVWGGDGGLWLGNTESTEAGRRIAVTGGKLDRPVIVAGPVLCGIVDKKIVAFRCDWGK